MALTKKAEPVCKCCAESRLQFGLTPRPLHLFDPKDFGKPVFMKRNYPIPVCLYCDGEAGDRILDVINKKKA